MIKATTCFPPQPTPHRFLLGVSFSSTPSVPRPSMSARSELSSSSKRSGGLFLVANTKKGKTTPKKRCVRAERSVWNSKDDWETLVADSALSTSSVSTRPPRPRGLHSLVKCASDAAARGFKRLWEDGVVMSDGAVVYGAGKRWKIAWEGIPDHLKVGLRDGIFKWWGSYVTLSMLQEVHCQVCLTSRADV